MSALQKETCSNGEPVRSRSAWRGQRPQSHPDGAPHPRPVEPRAWQLRADFSLPKADRRNEFLRARVNAGGGLDLFPNQGSGVLTSTVWGDGLIDNPPGRVIHEGDIVRFIPFAELQH